MSTLIEKSLALLQDRIPALQGCLQMFVDSEPVPPSPGYPDYPDRGVSHTAQRVSLPAAPEAEYRFELVVDLGNLVFAINAMPQPPVEGYLWSMWGEREDLGWEDSYVEGICHFAAKLLTRPSRIVQRKRRRHWELRCDTFERSGWVTLSTDSLPIGRGHGPPISDSEHVYNAPALYPQYAGRWERWRPPGPGPIMMDVGCLIILFSAIAVLILLLGGCA